MKRLRPTLGFRRNGSGWSFRFVVSVAILVLNCLTPSNAAAEGQLPPEIVARLAGELQENQFSGVLDVRAGDRTLWRHVSGTAASENSVFWVGSVSKQFAAVAALKLVDQGSLSFDGPIAEALGMGGSALRYEGVPCTLADVLNHTCGLPAGNVCSFVGLDDRRVQEKFLRCVADLRLDSKPGSAFVYSNVGYDLVGVLVSRAAGMSYEDFLQRELFAPLGMDSTGVDLRVHPDARRRLVQGEAYNGFGWSKTWPWLLLDPAGPGDFGAAGNIFSTAGDLHRWNEALHGGRVLSPALYSRLTTPGLSRYGLGVVIEQSTIGTQWIWHNGALAPMGWSSFVAYIPSEGISVVGLANRNVYSSHVIPATRSLVLAALNEPVDTPLLNDPGLREIVFFLLPISVSFNILRIIKEVVRGPRRGCIRWYITLLTSGALYLFFISLFDFFDRAAMMAPPLPVVIALGLALHRRKLVWPSRQVWRNEGGRLRLLGELLWAGLLGFLSGPTARLWLVAFIVSQALFLYFLIGRRTATSAAVSDPTQSAEPTAPA